MARSDASARLTALRRLDDSFVEPEPAVPERRPAGFRIDLITGILALALALLAGAGAALYQNSRPATYQSAATLLIDQPLTVAVADNDGPLAKLQRLRYQYASLLPTDLIAGPVGRQLNLPTATVEGSLSSVVNPVSFTLVVVARGGDAGRTSLIAQAAASQLTSYVAQQQQDASIPQTSRVVLTEVVTPRAGVKVAPTTNKEVVSAVVAFVVVGLGFLILADLLRRRR